MTRETLLLVEKCAHSFSWYDLESGERLRSLALPDFPHEFVVDAQQRYAWVGRYGVETSGHTGPGGHAVLQIDIRSGELVRSIDLYPFNRIHGLQLDAQGRLFALSEEKAVLLVLDDPVNDTAPSRAVPVGGLKSHLFTLSADGHTAWCMNLLTHTVTRVQPFEPLVPPLACRPGAKPEGCCLSEDERWLYVTNRLSDTLSLIDAQTMAVLRTVPTRHDATRLYRLAGGRLLATNYGDRSLSVFDGGTLQEVAHLALPARPIAASLHPLRPQQAQVSLDDDRVIVLDLATMQVQREFKTQREPDVSKVVLL